MAEDFICADCRFFNRDGETNGEPFGECRRHAPWPIALHDCSGWATVQGSHWCGEFEPKPKSSDGFLNALTRRDLEREGA